MHKPMFGSSVTIKSEHFNANITLHRYGVLKLGFDFEQEGQRFKLKKLGVIGENFHLIHAESLEPVFTFDWTYLSMSKRGDLHLFPEAMRKYRFEESFLIALALVYLDMVEDSHHHG
ncbi:hypothetical protein BC937DRAFT_93564 [Endogone sp. FLAS-F59071]|nr:hypothetical protein BC937DRAFT_93564 [Endogone sp. FLAS-F59071]|eukprot:RUS14610.1 hypothetical protein BC937DRAFT_93564 [Endogone sp. FLAS-F59071]